MKEYISCDSGFEIRMATEVKDNIHLLNISGKDDLWFHLTNFTSPNLVLFNNGKSITRNEAIQCCELVKNYSRQRNCKNVLVSFIKRKYIEMSDMLDTVYLFEDPITIVV